MLLLGSRSQDPKLCFVIAPLRRPPRLPAAYRTRGVRAREVPPSRVSIRAFITNLVPQGSEPCTKTERRVCAHDTCGKLHIRWSFFLF